MAQRQLATYCIFLGHMMSFMMPLLNLWMDGTVQMQMALHVENLLALPKPTPDEL